MADSKKINKSKVHHDNLSYYGHQSYGFSAQSKPKKTKSFSDTIVDTIFGPGPKSMTHGGNKSKHKK